MVDRRRRLVALALALATTATAAEPRPGQTLPAFEVDDITGVTHHSRELVGRYTLVLAANDVDADAALRAWGAEADRRLPRGVRRVVLLAFDLAFFIATATARSMARSRSPQALWSGTWMERHGELTQTLGLPDSEVPFVWVLDPRGRVVAAVHCAASDARAEAVWAALPR